MQGRELEVFHAIEGMDGWQNIYVTALVAINRDDPALACLEVLLLPLETGDNEPDDPVVDHLVEIKAKLLAYKANLSEADEATDVAEKLLSWNKAADLFPERKSTATIYSTM